MRAGYKTVPPDGTMLVRPAPTSIAVSRIRYLCPHPAFHFDYVIPLVIFLQKHDRFIREVGEQPVDPRLVIQDIVQLIDIRGVVR